MYEPKRPPRQERLALNGLEHRLLRWGGDQRPPILMLHGWMDAAATFQFVVDRLPSHLPVAGLDWRGFGESDWDPHGYWFPDYLADLDALLDVLSPGAPAQVVGHSMGGNVACLYAGARPERIARIVNLEGFGLPRTTPDQAPARYAQWLQQLRSPPGFASYSSHAQLAGFLCGRNPRLDPERAEYIARCWAIERAPGRIEIRADPRHKLVNPVLYRREEAEACWRQITAPMLFLMGELTEFRSRLGADASEARLCELFPGARVVTVADCGHMMHHEQPDAVARLIAEFLT